jgi:hypothetical protein
VYRVTASSSSISSSSYLIYPIRGGAIIGVYRPFIECPLQER